MGAISRGLKKIWNKNHFLLHSPPPPPPNLNYDWSLIILRGPFSRTDHPAKDIIRNAYMKYQPHLLLYPPSHKSFWATQSRKSEGLQLDVRKM